MEKNFKHLPPLLPQCRKTKILLSLQKYFVKPVNRGMWFKLWITTFYDLFTKKLHIERIFFFFYTVFQRWWLMLRCWSFLQASLENLAYIGSRPILEFNKMMNYLKRGMGVVTHNFHTYLDRHHVSTFSKKELTRLGTLYQMLI